jgi:hypothetical protein
MRSHMVPKNETEDVFIDIAVYEEMLWHKYGVRK